MDDVEREKVRAETLASNMQALAIAVQASESQVAAGVRQRILDDLPEAPEEPPARSSENSIAPDADLNR